MIEATVLVGELMRGATRSLNAAAIEQPAREAWWIWEKVSGVTRAHCLTHSAEPVDNRLATAFQAAVARRAGGEPLAHVLGEAEFRHLAIRTDRRALIPRPETEGLVDLVLERRCSGTVADIGTGTGCIALSLAREGGYDMVVAIERSPSALQLARTNIKIAGTAPVRLIAGDLCQSLSDSSLDVLVSNPPYLSEEEYSALPPAVSDWEPEAALRGGSDGMEATRRLLADGMRVVKPGGWIVMELDCSRAAEAAEVAFRAGWLDILVKDDLLAVPGISWPGGANDLMWDKAQELGRLIGQTPEYKGLRRAEASLREDQESMRMLENIQQLAKKMEQQLGAGQEPDETTAQAYEQAVRDLETSVAGQAYVVARANFEKVMSKVNQQISEGMEKGAQSSIITLG